MSGKKETSLSLQLKKLQVPQTQLLLLNDRRRVSFLYDPKEAANLDSESVHCLAVNGLEQLKQINQVFNSFEETLFSTTSINFERAVQTREVNDNLNTEIRRFLIELSPYFLLKPAHKTIEWLVYRYHIHSYNINDLFMCILPYHETNYFIRAIQMMNLESNHLWSWLINNQKSGVPLSSNTLSQHLINDLSFLNFLINYMNECIEIFTQEVGGELKYSSNGINLCTSFFTKSVVQAIGQQYNVTNKKINDAFVAQLLPFLYASLKSSQPTELKQSAYLLSAVLFQKCSFNKETVEKSVLAIIKSLKSSNELINIKSALVSLCLIIKSQQQQNNRQVGQTNIDIDYLNGKNYLTKSILKKLLKNMDKNVLIEQLKELNADCKVDEFLKLFYERLLVDALSRNAENSDEEMLLKECLEQITLAPNSSLIDCLIEDFFNLLSNYENNEENQPQISLLSSLLKDFERKCPQKFENMLKALSKHERIEHAITLFSFTSKTAFKYNYINDIGANLAVCLTHTNDLVRSKAIDFMRENTKNKEEIDNEFVLAQLKLRFSDDSVSVLNAIFKFDVDLIKYFTVRELSKHLVEAVFDKKSNDWMNCKKHAIEMLFTNIYSYYSKTKSGLAEVKSQFIDALIDIGTKIIEQKSSDLLKLMLESKFFKDEKIKLNVNEFYDGLKSWISSKNQSYVDEESSELMNFNTNKLELKTFLAFDLYLHSLELKTTSKQDNLIANCFKILKYFQTKCDFKEKIDLKSISDSRNKSIDDYLSTISTNKIKVNTFIDLFNRYLQVGNQLKTENDSVFEYLCVNSAKTPVFVYLIEQFISLNLQKSTLFFTYLHKYLIKSEKLVVSEGKNSFENYSNEISKLRSLHLLNKYIQEKHLLNEEPLLVNTYVITLASCLTSNYEQIRKEALNCLNKIQTQLTSNVHQQQEIEKQESTSVWYNFIKKLLKHSQEIIFDASYLANSQLNKIVSSNILTEINGIISKCSKTELIVYLNLLKKIKDEQKYELIGSLTNILSAKSDTDAQVMKIILSNFMVNSKTSEYFNKNSDKFDELIKYLSESDEYRNILLKQFEVYSEEFYQALNETHKSKLLDTLFNNLCVNKKETSNDKSEYKKIFANLIQDSKYFVYLLDKYLPELKDTQPSTTEQANTTKQMKKQMITESTTQQKPAPVINFNYLKQIIELLQLKLTDCDNEKKKSISDSLVLIPRLFTILSTLNDSQDKYDNSEYLQICSLNCIQLIYNYESKSKSDLNEKQFNIELLMQILKKTTSSDQSMQVQQQILLLLSDLAHLFPDKILQNVLVMFVFVGDKLARKDDLYSFHIMNKTIKTLLPAILNAKLSDKEKNQEMRDAADNAIHSNLDEIKPNLSKIVCKILQSFVITLPHIPAHRKWSIFSELLTIIGINNYLWITIIQSFDSYIVQKRDEDDKKLRDTLKQCTGMLQAIFVQFDLDNILQSAIYLIEFLNDYMTKCMFSMNDGALLKKGEIRNRYDYLGGLQFDEYTAINNKYFIYNLLVFVNELLVNGQFQEKLNASINTNTNKLFEILLEKILFNILYLNKAQHRPKNSEDDVKFLRALLNKFYDCMENVINSLDSQQFIEIIKKLLKHEQYQIKRRVLALLNNKLRKQEPNDKEISHLLTMIDDLLEAIQINNEPVDIEINNQTILFSIKLLCKRIGEQNQLAFMKVLKFVCENLINKANYTTTQAATSQPAKLKNTNLLSSVLLCLGELCLKLKSSSLIYLNKIMNFTLDIVQLEDTLNYDLLLLSCVTCLLKIIQNLANFLSPYLKKLLFISCSLSSMLTNKLKQQQLLPAAAAMLTSNISISSDIGIDIEAYINSQTNATSTTNKTLQNLELKLQQLRTSLATSIPLRLLAPLLNDESITFNDNMKLDNIEYYMQLTRHSIKISAQDDIVANLKPLRTMFMNLFNLRTLNANTKSPNDLCKFEDHLIDTYCELTYKLSEETFRPIFFKFFEWSTMNDPPKDRLITFYRTTYKLSDKLKSLFVLFSSHFLQNTIQTLDLLNKSKTEENYFLNKKDRTKYVYSNEKSRLLLYSCVDTLKNLFLYDTDKFLLNNDRFNIIMQPLVDLIENEIDFDSYKTFISEHLIPCMANFAALCVHDTTLCRKLNYQILLKSKHSSVQVRLATLDVLHKVSKQMGDLYNSIFTETAPFLAELMEDPVEEVEEKVQFVIKELEDMLGESLQGHFV